MMRFCRATGKRYCQFDKATRRCKCGRWDRGFAPKKEYVKPRCECQICERTQAVDADGTLGNHGYKRPGWGFIQGNCTGEGYQPFPATDALEIYLKRLEAHLEHCRNRTADLHNSEVEELTYAYTVRENGKKEEKKVAVKRGAAEERLPCPGETEWKPWKGITIPAFVTLAEWEISRLKNEIENATNERRRVVARIAKGKELQNEPSTERRTDAPLPVV